MTFSVIVPAYNAEKTLYSCLESVRNQSYSDFEVIVINDGSTDHTTQIMDEFASRDQRFKIVHQRNQGVSSARNNGIEKASGEYLVFLDSDDRYMADYLKSFYQMIESYPEYDHYWCSFLWMQSQEESMNVNACWDVRPNICLLNRSEIMTYHENIWDAALWNKVYKHRIIQQYGIRMRNDLSLGEDLLFNYQYLDVTKPEILMNQAPMYAYTNAENGTLNSKYRVNLESIYSLLDREILSYLRKWNVDQAQMVKYYNSVFYGQEMLLRNTFRKESKLSLFQKMRINTRVLHSEKFKTALKNADCFIHPLYRFGYTIGCWPLIMIFDKLVEIKKRAISD